MHELNLLGSITLRKEQGGERLPQPKRTALLVYLLLATPRGFRARDELLAMFWPESDQARGRASLRKAVHGLRKALGAEAVEGEHQRLRADPGRFRCDVLRFEEALEDGRLAEAVEFYRGDLLAGFHVSGAPAFHRWLDLERERLRRRAVDACVQLAGRAAAGEDRRAAARWVRRAVRTAPFDEALTCWGCRLLLDLGDRTAAIRLLESLVRRLEQEWEVPPSPATLELLEATRSPPASVQTGQTCRTGTTAVPGPAVAEPGPAPATTATPAPRRGMVAGADPEPVPTAPRIQATRGPARIPRAGPLTGTAVFALTVLTLSVTWGEPPPGEGSETTRRVVLMPFDAPDSAARVWAEALGDLVASNLSTFEGMEPLKLRAAPAADGETRGGSEDRARTLSASLGADAVVRGRVRRTGGRLLASAELWDAGADTWLGPFRIETDTDSLFSLADRLTVALVARAFVPDGDHNPRRSPDLPPRATTSPVALRSFLEGERFLRRGQWPEAVVRYRAAVEEDTAFAMAWFRLAQSFDQLSRPGARALYRRALEHPDRLGDRERSLVRGAILVVERRREAVDTLRNLVARHPFYPEAWSHLGAAYFHVGRRVLASPDDYRRALSRALELDPGSVWPYVHLIEDAFVQGDATRGRELVAGLRTAAGETAYGIGFALAGDLAWGGGEARRRAAGSLDHLSPRLRGPLARSMTVLELNPDFEPLLRQVATARFRVSSSEAERDNTRLHILRVLPRAGRAAEGLEILRTRMDMHGARPRMARSILTWHTVGYRAPGYAEQALAVLREVEEPSVREMFWVGAYGLAVGDTALHRTRVTALRSAAREIVAPWTADGGGPAAPPPPYVGLVADALEALALAERDPERAVAVLQRVHDSRDPEVTDDGILDYLRVRLGQLYRNAGLHERALRHFRAQNHHADLYVAPLELEVARTLSAMGRHEEAREHYARFARWWRDCDPSLRPLHQEAMEAFTPN